MEMIVRSSIRVRMGVRDIGLKSAHCNGLGTFAIGVITARFHCVGMLAEEIQRLNKCATGCAMKHEAVLRNH